jgi:3-oxoadipate enol-lactonase
MSALPPAVDLHYELQGPEDGQVLVLSHALGASMAMWEPQLPRLKERCRVVRYDHRGHGGSPVPPGPYRIDDLGRDLLQLLDRLELRRVMFCGLSLGGMVGMWMAINHPERIDRLVLCCTAARMMRPADYTARAGQVREHGMASVVDAVLARWFTSDFAGRQPETVEWVRAMLLATPAEGYAGACEALAAMDLRSDLSRINRTTLVIAGADDEATPVAQSREIARQIRHAKLVVIPGASHLANVVRSKEFTDTVMRFLI